MLLFSIQSWPRDKNAVQMASFPEECSLETGASSHRPGQCQARVPRGQWKYTQENKVSLSTRCQSAQGATRLSVSTGKGLVRGSHSGQGETAVVGWAGVSVTAVSAVAEKKRTTKAHEGHEHLNWSRELRASSRRWWFHV